MPTFVQLELAKWLVRETGEDQADQANAFTQKCVLAPLADSEKRLTRRSCAGRTLRGRKPGTYFEA